MLLMEALLTIFSLDPAAARAFSQKIFNDPAPAESEDCLYLNVEKATRTDNRHLMLTH